jgi:hypothetical protein
MPSSLPPHQTTTTTTLCSNNNTHKQTNPKLATKTTTHDNVANLQTFSSSSSS